MNKPLKKELEQLSKLVDPSLLDKVNLIIDLCEHNAKRMEKIITLSDKQQRDVFSLTKKAEKANKAKTTFLSKMSHELRTPMHGIISFANLGVFNAETATPKKNTQYFNNIQISAERLLTLIDESLDIAKIESGTVELALTSAPVISIIQSCIAEQQARLDDFKQKVVIEDTTSNGITLVDQNRISQVFTNLLSNAIKYTPEKENIDISMSNTSDYIEIRIRDYGIGIPDKDLKNIFNAYIQSSNKPIHPANSTGLGLSICEQIVKLHQGKIWAENHPEQGAVFIVQIPIMTQ